MIHIYTTTYTIVKKMTLKIKYLNRINGSSKNQAVILSKETKISDFKGIFDDKTNQKILNFLKKNKRTKDNRIFSLNLDFDKKLIIILVAHKNESF